MNAVVGAIYESLQNIRIIFDPTHSSFKKDTKHTADSRELSVKEFLESFFPLTYKGKKGQIYNLTSISQEIDCVILAPNHPILVTPKREVILAEGVYAAIEVKPDISSLTKSSEFHRGLIQLQSVKKIERELPIVFKERDIPKDFHRIPTIMFSNKAQSAEKTINYMRKCVCEYGFSSYEMPDMIVTLDRDIIFHTTHFEKTLFCQWVKQQHIDKSSGEIYIHLKTGKENTLGVFLLILYCFIPPEPRLTENFLKKYLIQGLSNLEYSIYDAI